MKKSNEIESSRMVSSQLDNAKSVVKESVEKSEVDVAKEAKFSDIQKKLIDEFREKLVHTETVSELEIQRVRQENELNKQLAEQKIEKLKADREMQKESSRLVFSYLKMYSSAVFVILILSGFNLCSFYLDSSVLQLLVGSTAVSAIGLVLAVVTGLFLPGKSKNE